jgi:hypothetical protein
MTDLIAQKAANAHRWTVAKPTRNFAGVAAQLVDVAAKARWSVGGALTLDLYNRHHGINRSRRFCKALQDRPAYNYLQLHP